MKSVIIEIFSLAAAYTFISCTLSKVSPMMAIRRFMKRSYVMKVARMKKIQMRAPPLPL